MREVSIIKLDDCLRAFRRVCSSVLGLKRSGDLISNSMPSSRMSAVLILETGRNSTVWPARARILATRSSCGQGVRLAGRMIFALQG